MAVDIKRGRPSASEVARVELAARAHEAEAFTIAARLTLRELEAVLLRPQYEYPVEALSLVARLREMTTRYRARWEPAA